MLHGVRHALTPGTPVYAALKMGALGSVFLLQRTVRKRAEERAEEERAAAAARQQAARRKRKRRR